MVRRLFPGGVAFMQDIDTRYFAAPSGFLKSFQRRKYS
jgi:hypothetical protein